MNWGSWSYPWENFVIAPNVFRLKQRFYRPYALPGLPNAQPTASELYGKVIKQTAAKYTAHVA